MREIPTLENLPEEFSQAEGDGKKASRNLIDRPETGSPKGVAEVG